MAGDIFWGLDASQPMGKRTYSDYVNNSTFDAFDDLLTEALTPTCTTQLEKIKESEFMKIFSFCDLSTADYNLVIQTMRRHVDWLETQNPTDWQRKGMWVWHEMAEPFIRKDKRYDFAFHGEERPASWPHLPPHVADLRTPDYKITDGPNVNKTVIMMYTTNNLHPQEIEGLNKFFEKSMTVSPGAGQLPRGVDQIEQHFNHADLLVMDTRPLTPENQKILMDHIATLAPQQRSRITLVR